MSLVAWYPLNGDTLDYSGNGNSATNSGATIDANGKVGKCYSFAESGANKISTNVSYNSMNKGNMSIAFWFKNTSTANKKIMGNRPNGDMTRWWEIETNATGQVRFEIADGYPTNYYLSSYTSASTEWTHIVAIISQGSTTSLKLYKNGVLEVDASSVNSRLWDLSAADIIEFGNDAGGTGCFGGYLNDVRIYNHILSEKEIKEISRAKILHYTFDTEVPVDGGVVTDSSGFQHHSTLTISSAPTWISSNAKIGKGAYSFSSATAEYICIPNSECKVTEKISVSVWAYRTNWNEATSERIISCTEGGGWSLGFNDIAGSLTAVIYCNGVYTNVPVSLSTISAGWHHIVFTFDGRYQKMYLDGVLKGTVDKGATYPLTYNATNGIFIGAEATGSNTIPGGQYWNGIIDDVRIYATALSQDDVTELYGTRASLDDKGNLYATQFIEHSSALGTQDNPAKSALEILENGNSTGDGVYYIKMKDGSTLPIYCDMTNDGGGWMRVFYHYNANGTILFSSAAEGAETNINTPTTSDKYSILSKLENFRPNTSTKFEFRLKYPELAGINIWRQLSNPAAPTTANSGVTGYEPVSISWTTSGWGGLEYNGIPGVTLIDGTVNSGNWYYAIGAMAAWSGKIPGPASAINYVELYVREIGDLSLSHSLKESGVYEVNDISEVGITEGLAAYYPLDGDVKDYSGNNLHGTINGAVTTTTGIDSLAYAITNNAYINTGISDMTGFINTNGGFTISVFALGTSDAYNVGEGIVFGGNGYNWGICYGTGNFHINMWGDDGTKASYQARTVDTVNANQWYHIVAYFDKTTNKLGIYLNGVFQQETTVVKPFWISSNVLRFGSGAAGVYWVTASVCDGKVFNRVLTQEEIGILYETSAAPLTPAMKVTNNTVYVKGEFKETVI